MDAQLESSGRPASQPLTTENSLSIHAPDTRAIMTTTASANTNSTHPFNSPAGRSSLLPLVLLPTGAQQGPCRACVPRPGFARKKQRERDRSNESESVSATGVDESSCRSAVLLLLEQASSVCLLSQPCAFCVPLLHASELFFFFTSHASDCSVLLYQYQVPFLYLFYYSFVLFEFCFCS